MVDAGKPLFERKVQPMCHEVFEWPEFRAFCRRLGVNLSVDTERLQVTFTAPNVPVVVSHTYQATSGGMMSQEGCK